MQSHYLASARLGRLISLSFVILFGAAAALADSVLTVNSNSGMNNPLAYLNNSGRIGVAQRSTSKDLSVRFRASCYATNLRGVANPISPDATIEMSGMISINNAIPTAFSVQFPSRVVVGGGLSGKAPGNLDMSTSTGLGPNARLAAAGNMVILKMVNGDKATLDPVTATISQTETAFNISNLSFNQIVRATSGAPTSQEYQEYKRYAELRQNHVHDEVEYAAQIADKTYLGKDGPLSGTLAVSKSTDGKTLDIEASFPGEAMFCGGYYSPLMIFFDEKRPHFNNITDFDMGTGLKTHWPEKNHPGYFVALPQKNKVISKNQLFGEEKDFSNGFLKLAQHDQNRDGKIDAKDPVFKKLVLWKDRTGRGMYRAQDTILLHKKVKSIDLKYSSQIEAVGANAEFREKSFIDIQKSAASGSQNQGEVIDVWLKPVSQK